MNTEVWRPVSEWDGERTRASEWVCRRERERGRRGATMTSVSSGSSCSTVLFVDELAFYSAVYVGPSGERETEQKKINK